MDDEEKISDALRKGARLSLAWPSLKRQKKKSKTTGQNDQSLDIDAAKSEHETKHLQRAKQILPDLEKLDIAPVLLQLVENLTDEQWRSIRQANPSLETKAIMSHVSSVIVNIVAEASLMILLPALEEILSVDLRSVLRQDLPQGSQHEADERTKDVINTSSTRYQTSALEKRPLQDMFGISEDKVLNTVKESIQLSMSELYSQVSLRSQEMAADMVKEIVHQVNLALRKRIAEIASGSSSPLHCWQNSLAGSQAAEKMIENVSAMLSSALSEYSGTDSPASVPVDKTIQTDLVIAEVIAAVLDTYWSFLDDHERNLRLMEILSTLKDKAELLTAETSVRDTFTGDSGVPKGNDDYCGQHSLNSPERNRQQTASSRSTEPEQVSLSVPIIQILSSERFHIKAKSAISELLVTSVKSNEFVCYHLEDQVSMQDRLEPTFQHLDSASSGVVEHFVAGVKESLTDFYNGAQEHTDVTKSKEKASESQMSTTQMEHYTGRRNTLSVVSSIYQRVFNGLTDVFQRISSFGSRKIQLKCAHAKTEEDATLRLFPLQPSKSEPSLFKNTRKENLPRQSLSEGTLSPVLNDSQGNKVHLNMCTKEVLRKMLTLCREEEEIEARVSTVGEQTSPISLEANKIIDNVMTDLMDFIDENIPSRDEFLACDLPRSQSARSTRSDRLSLPFIRVFSSKTFQTNVSKGICEVLKKSSPSSSSEHLTSLSSEILENLTCEIEQSLGTICKGQRISEKSSKKFLAPDTESEFFHSEYSVSVTANKIYEKVRNSIAAFFLGVSQKSVLNSNSLGGGHLQSCQPLVADKQRKLIHLDVCTKSVLNKILAAIKTEEETESEEKTTETSVEGYTLFKSVLSHLEAMSSSDFSNPFMLESSGALPRNATRISPVLTLSTSSIDKLSDHDFQMKATKQVSEILLRSRSSEESNSLTEISGQGSHSGDTAATARDLVGAVVEGTKKLLHSIKSEIQQTTMTMSKDRIPLDASVIFNNLRDKMKGFFTMQLPGAQKEKNGAVGLVTSSISQVLGSIHSELEHQEVGQNLSEHLLARDVLSSMLEHVEDGLSGSKEKFEGPTRSAFTRTSSSKSPKSKTNSSQEGSTKASISECDRFTGSTKTIMSNIVKTIFGMSDTNDIRGTSSTVPLTANCLQTLISSGRNSRDIVDQVRCQLEADVNPLKKLSAGISVSDAILHVAHKEKSISKPEACQLVNNFAEESVKYLLLHCRPSLNPDVDGFSTDKPKDDIPMPSFTAQYDLNESQDSSKLFDDIVHSLSTTIASRVMKLLSTTSDFQEARAGLSLGCSSDRVDILVPSVPKSDKTFDESGETDKIAPSVSQIQHDACDNELTGLCTIIMQRLLTKIHKEYRFSSADISFQAQKLIQQFLSKFSSHSGCETTQTCQQDKKMDLIYRAIYKNLEEEYGRAHLLQKAMDSQDSTFDKILVPAMTKALEQEGLATSKTNPGAYAESREDIDKAKKGIFHFIHSFLNPNKILMTPKKSGKDISVDDSSSHET